MGQLARNNRMLDIFSREKKKVCMVTQMFRLLDIFFNAFSCCYAFSSCFGICFFLKVLLWRLCFSKNIIFSSRAFICFFGVAHFIHSLPLLIFCSGCLVIIANKFEDNFFLWLQTYSNTLIEGISLNILRNKRELDLEQAI